MTCKNIISLDTVQAFCNTWLDIVTLLDKGWVYWPSNKEKEYDEYIIWKGNLRFKYIPQYNYLSVRFSAAKIQNGSNAIPFNFDDIDLLKQYINIAINTVLPANQSVPVFDNWTINEMHPYVDYAFDNKSDAKAYQECVSKTIFKRCKNTTYETGNQARNKSYSYNIYLKEEQIKDNLKNKPKTVNKIDKGILLKNRNISTLRFEAQAKKYKLHKLFKESRQVKDLLNLHSCKAIINHFIVENQFHNPYSKQSHLMDKIEKSFSATQCKTIKQVIQIYNQIGLDEAKKIRKESTIMEYFRTFKSKGINPIYLPNSVRQTIDFTKYVTVGISLLIDRVIKYVLEELLISVKVDTKPLKTSDVKEMQISFINLAYFYEDGG